jgi:hypothetical protein
VPIVMIASSDAQHLLASQDAQVPACF